MSRAGSHIGPGHPGFSLLLGISVGEKGFRLFIGIDLLGRIDIDHMAVFPDLRILDPFHPSLFHIFRADIQTGIIQPDPGPALLCAGPLQVHAGL